MARLKKEETVDYHIKATWHAISRMYNQEAAKYGTTMSTGYVLLNINPEEGTRATAIAPLLGMESTSLSRVLKTLEERGQIERKPDPEDGRAVRIWLTEEGKESRNLARETVTNFNKHVRENIPADQLEIFFEVIQKIGKSVDSQKILNDKRYEQEQVN